jgi:hypothetical protein
MEIIRRYRHVLYCQVLRQVGIQGSVQSVETVAPIQVEGSHLPAGMGTGIRPPRQVYRSTVPPELVQGFFDFTLDRSGSRLSLAAQEVGTVVCDDDLVTSHFRSGNL